MEVTLKSLKDTQKLAKDIAQKVFSLAGPVAVALYGNLGSGKTTFVQFFAKALGIKEKVLSPTFVIIKTFRITKGYPLYRTLTHIDTYRLKSAKDLLALGFKDILKDKENITIIEWPEKIWRYLPKNTIKICFEVTGEQERKATIKIPKSY